VAKVLIRLDSTPLRALGCARLRCMSEAVDSRYPLGRFVRPEKVSAAVLEEALAEIAALPAALRAAVAGLGEDQLLTPYREGGWTVRQVVHHVVDSHVNSYTRMKLALTEDEPTILPYDENAWAALKDGVDAPVEWSLVLLEMLHARWVMLLESLTPKQWQRGFVHPEHGRLVLESVALMYAWHGRHHVGHITALRAARGW